MIFPAQDLLFVRSFLIGLHRIDGELRTYDFTIMAINAFMLFFDLRGVIALLIEACGKLEDFLWTEFNAIAAPLATIIKDMHDPPCDLNVIDIKWSSPVCHCYNQARNWFKISINIHLPIGRLILGLGGNMSSKKCQKQVI
jgi:hypothetical protein